MTDTTGACCQNRNNPSSMPNRPPKKRGNRAGDECANCCQNFGDCETEVVSIDRTYATITQPASGHTIKYNLKVFISDKDEIHVTIRLKKNEIYAGFPLTLESYVQTMNGWCSNIWDNKYKIEVKKNQCESMKLKVYFHLELVEANYHYLLNIFPGNDPSIHRANVGNGKVQMFYSASYNSQTTAHEFGHMFGLPDEYKYNDNDTSRQTVIYKIPPSNQNGPEIVVSDYDGLMGRELRQNILERYYYPIAIEVQKLIRRNTGYGDVECKVVRN